MGKAKKTTAQIIRRMHEDLHPPLAQVCRHRARTANCQKRFYPPHLSWRPRGIRCRDRPRRVPRRVQCHGGGEGVRVQPPRVGEEHRRVERGEGGRVRGAGRGHHRDQGEGGEPEEKIK